MENIIIGTAGHVDHGKTTLIKALTGIDTDTMVEEKERGMSINIGFAYFDLLSGKRVGIVDVPGHEKFIKNMMAGLAGLNLVLLVIDAGEGIMPQTKEHIDILQLLGVKDYVIVLTKAGTVEQELLELVEEDIREQFIGTNLEQAPIMKVDSILCKGISELKGKIDEISVSIEKKNPLLPPRMHIDRTFTVKGFGTVVTGTLIEGKINHNDEVMIYPLGILTKIRGIQVHGEKVTEVVAGQRTALNLSNVKLSEIERGNTLSTPNMMEDTWMLDVKLKMLPHVSKAIKLWDRLRLHIGTREILCRVVPLGIEEIEAGQEAFVQLRLEEKAVAQRGDKCILRTYSPMETIGGAVILDSKPVKHKRFNESILDELKIKEQGSVEDILCDFIARQSNLLVTVNELINEIGLRREEIECLVEKLVETGNLIKLNGMYLHSKKYEELKNHAVINLTKYHKVYRLRMGMPKEELRSKFSKQIKGKDLDLLLQKLADEEVIKIDKGISLFDFYVKYNAYQLKDKQRIEKKLKESQFLPMVIEELTEGTEALNELIESLNNKTIVRLDSNTVIHMDYYKEAVRKVQEFIMENDQMTLAQFRDMTGSSRKYSMIMLEFMDKNKITKRVDNMRVLY